MGYDKKTFLKNVTIICDTREQKNSHILSRLDEMGIAYKHESLDFGDYSFVVAEKVKDGTKTRNFTQSCLIERKANVNELYGNLTIDRERIEKEFLCGSSLSNEFTLLIEGVSNFDELYEYELPEWQMKNFNRKVKNIGFYCYETIQSWQSGSKYKFRTIFSKDKEETAVKILECFYWYWRNYKKMTAGRRNRG